PIGPELQYTDEKKPSEITLYVYSGADAEFTLYEDEGTNYDYEIGKRSTIPIHYNDRNKTITIHQRSGEFNGMLKNRSFDIVFIEPDSPKGFDNNQSTNQKINYMGKEIRVKIVE